MKFKRITAMILTVAMASMLMLSGCGNSIDSNKVVTTVGEEQVTLGYANFVARFNQVSYDSMFSTYYGSDFWTNEELADDEGRTMEEAVKAYIMEDIQTSYMLKAHMADYGVELTDEDVVAIEAAADAFMESNSKEAIKELGATKEYVTEMLTLETIKHKMEEAIKAGADTDVAYEDCVQRTFSYIKVDMLGASDGEGGYIPFTDEQLQEIMQGVSEMGEMAKGDFYAAAESYGYEVQAYSYGVNEPGEDEGGFNSDVIMIADFMQEGEVSDVIETEDAYYIIRLDSENDVETTERERDHIISERQNDLFTEVVDGYRAEMEPVLDEAAWAQVKFTNLLMMKQAEPEETAETTQE